VEVIRLAKIPGSIVKHIQEQQAAPYSNPRVDSTIITDTTPKYNTDNTINQSHDIHIKNEFQYWQLQTYFEETVTCNTVVFHGVNFLD